MNNKTFGYARVSTKEQNLDRQVEELKKYGIDERDIFLDKESGKDFNREAYQRLVNHSIRAGDIIVIKSIDRLGRNYEQILEQWRKITKELEVDIVVLDMPLLNTAKNKDLMGTLISDIVLQLLSFVSQKEREHIKQRQAEGIAIAKQKGKHMGRPTITFPENWEEYYIKWKNKEISSKSCQEVLGVKKDTFYKLVHQYESK